MADQSEIIEAVKAPGVPAVPAEKTLKALALDFMHAGKEIAEHGAVLFWARDPGGGDWHWDCLIRHAEEVVAALEALKAKRAAGAS